MLFRSPTKVFRLSGCLAVVGVFLLVPSILLFCFAVLTGVLGTAATGSASVQSRNDDKQKATAEMRAIEGLPSAIVAEFETNRKVAVEMLSALTPAQSNEVMRVQTAFQLKREMTSAVTGIAAVFGGGFVLVMLALSIPGMIVGGILILRKKVWKCPACGYIFDRA